MRTAFADAAAARDGTGTQTRQLTLDEIIKTPNPYLEAVIEEIFRFSVVIPIVSRMATVDTTILGHPIPKGTEVVFCFNGPDFLKPGVPLPPVDASKRSETSKASTVGDWNPDDVDKFIPERWMDVDADGNEVFNALKGPMLSFGGGPRGCFGKRLAYLEMRVVLTLVVWNFELLPILPSRRPVGILENITVEPSEVLVRMKSLVG
jgi:cytochrome P450